MNIPRVQRAIKIILITKAYSEIALAKLVRCSQI